MGLLQIRDRLNADPERCPPPVPIDPTTARGAWSRSSVWEVLRNPKYTGYQVWNRRARKKGHNRTNPADAWIWSEEPAHPAIVSREEYDAVQVRAKANMRSRQGVPATVARPRARNDYLYRGLLRCGICGLRMWGNRKRDVIYYSCQPSHQRAKNIPAGHPSHLYLNEQRLNDSLIPFLAASLFGPQRIDYWRHCLEAASEPEHCAPTTERANEIEAEITELERRLERQLLNLEADDITPALRRHVARRVDELEAAIGARREQLGAIDRTSPTEAPRLADVAPLLDRLPILAVRLHSVPQGRASVALRRDAARRRLPTGRQRRRCLTHALRWRRQPAHRRSRSRVRGLVGAPGRIRTCDPPLRRRPLYPTELQGLEVRQDHDPRD
jgi:site-specific DNA recombinase